MSDHPPPCPSCAAPMTGRFCASCGEKRRGPDDHTLLHVAGHLSEAFTHADGKIFLSLRLLLTQPGQLTADYWRGRRRPYIPALQLFLIANLIFFLLHPFIGGSNMLTTDLDAHLHYMWHSALARSLVAPRLAARGLTEEAYAAIFNPAAVTQAKTLVIFVAPCFALASMALYWRQRPRCVAHLIFALHVCAFWLLFICVSLTLTNVVLHVLRGFHIFPSADMVVAATTTLSVAVMTAYLYRSVLTIYSRAPVWVTIAKAAALALALELSLQAYRLALFFTTFWAT